MNSRWTIVTTLLYFPHFCLILPQTEKRASFFFTQKLPKKANVRQKKDLVLECMLSDPRPAVKWLKNGEPLEVNIGVMYN